MNYKLTITKSRNARCFYIQTSYRRQDGRVSTKTVRRLGSESQIKEKYGVDDAEAWARAQLEQMRENERAGRQGVLLELFTDRRVGGSGRVLHGGDIYIEKVCSLLGLQAICSGISASRGFKFDLWRHLTRMICCRILSPGSKLSDHTNGRRFVEGGSLRLENFYRSLDVMAENFDHIQGGIYRSTVSSIGRNTGVIYYDCTNVFFETECDDDFRKYGHSKENRPNPIVQIGLFMDMDGLPLALCVHPGNKSEQQTLQPLEEVLAQTFGLSKFVVCTDGGLGSRDNRLYNVTEDRNFITVQSIKKLGGHFQEWALAPDGWRLRPRLGDDPQTRCRQVYNLGEIDLDKYYDDVFYKECLTDEKAFEEHLIVTYSRKYELYQRKTRMRQIERAISKINRGETKRPKSPSDCRRFIRDTHFDNKGNPLAVITASELDSELIAREERFDGFGALATGLDDDPCTIITVNSWRWEIEECFRIGKSDIEMRPVYVRNEKRIRAHLLICFIALLALKILYRQLGKAYPVGQIRKALEQMSLLQVEGFGYVPAFDNDQVTRAIQDNANIHIDWQIMTKAKIRSLYRCARGVK